MAIPTILLVAIPTGHQELRRSLREHFKVQEATHPDDAARLPRNAVTAMIGCTGTNVAAAAAAIRALRTANAELPIVILAERGSEALAVAALRAGATDYYPASSPVRELVAALRARIQPQLEPSEDPLVGGSPSMRQLRASLDQVARTDATVLITGETGTGKELAAARLHAASRRLHRPFVSMNCAAVPDALLESELFGYQRGAFTGADTAREGLLARAQGGTVFFDEVGDMSPSAQAKVLRAIEAREIVPLGGRASVPLDVRIVAATNQDLERAVGEGRFRKDLYFRLNVVRIQVPPLRERRSDIPSLLAHYTQRYAPTAPAGGSGFTEDATASLQRYEWPGNVRELKNLVESVFAFAASVPAGLKDLPAAFLERLPPAAADPASERAELLAALLEARWNKSRAARQLRCSRMTLYRRIERLKLNS